MKMKMKRVYPQLCRLSLIGIVIFKRNGFTRTVIPVLEPLVEEYLVVSGAHSPRFDGVTAEGRTPQTFSVKTIDSASIYKWFRGPV